MVLNTDWAQVEVIDLINDGSGLAFGIIGGRSTGVVVKTIVPGGVADRDGRLQSGDHILQIGEVNLRGLGSEQVASVLRQCGVHVRMVVARPVESTSTDYQALGSHAPIVPTKILGDPVELDKHLNDNGFGDIYMQNPSNSYTTPYIYTGQQTDVQLHTISGLVDVVRNPLPIGAVPSLPPQSLPPVTAVDLLPLDMALRDSTPETEIYTIDLMKDELGLGITVAGYVCEKEEISGIFVKSISKGSAADLTGTIKVNDRIIEVDGKSVLGYTNHQAVELLRSTGNSVKIRFERYLRGPKYEQLQQAILANELRPPSPPSPSVSSLPKIPLSLVRMSSLGIEPECESRTSFDFDSNVFQDVVTPTNDINEIVIDTADGRRSVQFSICSHDSIHTKWQEHLRDDVEIVIAEMTKEASSGLGISLEGTVDVEDGQEVRPHHYIRNILPNGPVGLNNILKSGDELLEVNGIKLLGLNHLEVVSILKQLPSLVLLVCARYSVPTRIIDTSQHRDAFQARNILAGSLNALIQSSERLVKAKSDTSITSSIVSETGCSRSRSLELVAGLAMWSNEPSVVILNKGDHGLGFSILDYQDPLNPQETVIVIRSLIPGGVAQLDGSLIPGDRLLAVNDIDVEHVSLDRAVQVLKGAPKGAVKITVAKPLSAHDSISHHSQDTEDDQTCIDDFQECIEEYQECLEVVQISIEEDRSFNHSPCLSQVEDFGNNQNPTPKFIEDISSEPELSFKSLCDINSTKIENNNLTNQVCSVIKTDLVQSDRATLKHEDSEKDGYETCLDESFSDEVIKEDKTPTNSIHNLGKMLVDISEDNVILNKAQLELEMAQVNEELQKITKKKESLKKKVKKRLSVETLEDRGERNVEGKDEQVVIPNTISYQSFARLYVNTKYPKNDQIDKNIETRFESNYSFPKQILPNQKQLEASQSQELLEKKVRNKTIKVTKSLEGSQDYNEFNKIVFNKEVDIPPQVKTLQNNSKENLECDLSEVTSDLCNRSQDLKATECLESRQNEIKVETVPTQTKLDSNHTNSLPCLHSNSKFSPHDEGLKSYDHANVPTREDEFFLVQYTEDLPEKCQSEPNVLDSSLTTKTYRYRIEEYYNDIEDCLEEVKKVEEMDDDEIFGEIFLGVRSKSAPDIFDNSFITLTYDPGPDVKNRRKSSFLPGIYNLSEDVSMTVHRAIESNANGKKPSDFDKIMEKHWGPPRTVEIFREANTSLGISIVGGKVDLYHESSSETVLGIFIKNVVKDSPAGRSGVLKTGDRILEVSGVSLKNVSHAKAVETIKYAKNPIIFRVQSILTIDAVDSGPKQNCKSPTGFSYGDSNRYIFPEKSARNSAGLNHQTSVESREFPLKDYRNSIDSIKYGSKDSEKFFDTKENDNKYDKDEEGNGFESKRSVNYESMDSNRMASSTSDGFGSKEFKRSESRESEFSKKSEADSNEPVIVSSESKEGLKKQKSVDFGEVLTVTEKELPRQKTVESSEESDDEEDVRLLEGRTVSAKGEEIDRASAANLRRSQEEIDLDPEEEDDFGYTMNKVKKKYSNLGHSILMVQLERSAGQGLGLSLAGHKDRNCMAVFVCGINPNGAAHRAGGIQVGDEILEVNGVVLHGRCHLNASAIIKGLSGPIFKVIILRRKAAIDDIAVRPITQFPVSLAEEASEESFSNYPNVRTISIKKGSQSLGIMIIEGKHAEVGQGIFISDIQEGSSAEKAGLEIGEMILAVNKDPLLGSNYDTAANLLKRTEGLVTLVVSNPGKRATTPEPDKNGTAKGLKPGGVPSRPTTPVPEPPADPSTCQIVPGRETTIEIASDNKTLGLCFVGGKDTPISGGIMIVEVYPGGAAEKDGRLQPADQIMDVNGTALKDVTHNAASQALRQTLPKMKLIVYRPDKADFQTIDAEFVKKPGKGLGLSVAARKSGKGVYVSEILNGGCADVDGKIIKGDLLVSVNGQNINESSGEEAGAALKTVTGKVTLKLHRYKPTQR